MLIAGAVCPHPPLLIPEALGSAASDPPDELRKVTAAAARAVAGLAAAPASRTWRSARAALGGEVVNADSMQLYRGHGHRHRQADRGRARAYRITCSTSGTCRRPQRGRLPAHRAARPSTAIERTRPGADPGRRLRAVRPGGPRRPRLPRHRRRWSVSGSRPSSPRAARPRLHARLAALDPAAAAAILPSNGRRIVRALEVIEMSGAPVHRDAARLRVGRTPRRRSAARRRGELDERIDGRVARMWRGGLVDEVAAWSRRAARRPDRQPGARLRAGAAAAWRGVARRTGPRGDRPGHPAVRPPPGVVVPPRSARPLAAPPRTGLTGHARPVDLRGKGAGYDRAMRFAKGHGTENDFVILLDPDGSRAHRRVSRPGCATAGRGSAATGCSGWCGPPR